LGQDNDNPERPQVKKRAIRIGSLANLSLVASELARMYRQARRQEISASDASKLASVLAVLRQCLEASDLEKRMAELEDLLSPGEADNVIEFPARSSLSGAGGQHRPMGHLSWGQSPSVGNSVLVPLENQGLQRQKQAAQEISLVHSPVECQG
jgi:hypothetical protein